MYDDNFPKGLVSQWEFITRGITRGKTGQQRDMILDISRRMLLQDKVVEVDGFERMCGCNLGLRYCSYGEASEMGLASYNSRASPG